MSTTTCHMSGQPITAAVPRDSKGRAQCPGCLRWYTPTIEKLFRYHMRKERKPSDPS